MTTHLPPPLVPAEVDLRDFPSMLLDVSRLRDSTLASGESGDAFRAAVLLWATSWHQVPAGSLPDDDAWIATQAGYALRGKIDRSWSKVRDGALRKFIRCSDGRLYHPVVCEKALECWLSKLGARLSSGAGNAKKHQLAFDPKPVETQIEAARAMLSALNPQSRALTRRRRNVLSSGVPDDYQQAPNGRSSGTQQKGKGREEEGISVPNGTDGAEAPAPPDGPKAEDPLPPPPPPPPPKSPEDMAKAELWRAAVDVLQAGGCNAEATCRSFMGKLVGDYTFPIVQQAVAAAATAQPADAREYLKATCQRLKGERVDPVTVASDAAEKTKAALESAATAHAADLASRTPEKQREIAERVARARQVAAEAALRNSTKPQRHEATQ